MNDYYRFRLTSGFLIHLWKSITRQDHKNLKVVIRPYLPQDGVAIDVGAHGGQITRLLSRLTPYGKVIAVEPNSYTRSILRMALWLRGCRNVIVVATALGAGFAVSMIRTPIKRHGDMGYGLSNLLDGGGAVCGRTGRNRAA
ncbi:MAG TPA: FkbM family methyltransferase [Acidiphilium sp.]